MLPQALQTRNGCHAPTKCHQDFQAHGLQAGGLSCEIVGVLGRFGTGSRATEGVSMAEDDLIWICLDELCGSDEVGATRKMTQEIWSACSLDADRRDNPLMYFDSEG